MSRLVTGLAVAAVAVGTPLYLALDGLRLLPVPLRDRPAPLEAVAVLLTTAALVTSLVCARRRQRGARWALGAALAATVATFGFSAFARIAYHRLDAPSPSEWLGRSAPLVGLEATDGAPVSLSSLRGAPSLLLFFRGAACPYCREQLAGLAEQAPRFLAEGVRVVAISPDEVGELAHLQRQLGTTFPLLSDADERVVTPLCGGLAHCEVLLDAEGVVRWAGGSESWSGAPRPVDLLQAAYRLAHR